MNSIKTVIVNAALAFILLFFPSVALSAQTQTYSDLISKAQSLYEAKNYTQAGETFEQAFSLSDKNAKVVDRYNASCSWALAGNSEKAFSQLNRIADSGDFSILSWIINDSDLENLHNNSAWDLLISKLKKNKELAEAGYNKELYDSLSKVYDDDQTLRMQLPEVEKKYGLNSEELKKHWRLIHMTDSINQKYVMDILDEHGWLGPAVVGNKGNQALFLVIQHAEIDVQEKYLPMLEEAVKKGNAPPQNLAYLEDRVAMRKGEKQKYGTQVIRDGVTGESYLYPVENPDNLDSIRHSIGLNSISDYLKGMDINWDLEEYKKKLPELEKKRIR